MKVNNLGSIVLILVLVGMITGVGILTLDKFSTATRTTTGVVNETITLSGTSASLANNHVLGISAAANASESVLSTTTFTEAGVVTISNGVDSTAYNISYSYGLDTRTSLTTDNASAAISEIPTVWLSLIITIVVLSIIISLVISSFTGRR